MKIHRQLFATGLTALCLGCATTVIARPHAGFSGLAASADSAATASTNPAGIVRLGKSSRVELTTIYSSTTWEEQRGDDGPTVTSDESTTIVVPMGYLVHPINEDFTFAFTILGAGFSEDFGNWPGRYFISSYDAANISAFPSLAYRVNDKFSIAASLTLTYSIFDQERYVANLFDPGFSDGRATLETDGIDVGFGASFLHEITDRTRWGLNYLSETDPKLEGKVKFSGLGPNTEAVLDKAGILGAEIEVRSKSPQALLGGVYHEFTNEHAITADVAWVEFSEFQLSEFYFDGNALADNEAKYENIFAFSLGYTWPVSERWMLGASALYIDEMIRDEERTLTLRLDSIWSVAFAGEWKWREDRAVFLSLSYMDMGDAPIETPPIPGIGSLFGEFTQRDLYLLRIGVNFGAF